MGQKMERTFSPEFVRYMHGLEIAYFATVLASHIVMLYILHAIPSPYSVLIFVVSLVFWCFNARNILLAGLCRQERQELEQLLGPL